MAAAWPEPAPRREDEEIEANFGLAQDFVRGIREIRAQQNIPPSRKLDALVKASGRSAEILGRMKPLVLHMGRLESLAIAADMERPATAAAQVVGDIEIYLAGAVDAAKERLRLESRRKKVVEDLRKTEARLSNESFVGKAPAEVVAKERQKLADLQTEIELIDANLKAL